MKTILVLLIATFSVMLLTAQARIGYTLAECRTHYGKETAPSDGQRHYFQTRTYGIKVGIYVRLFEGTVDKIDYLNFSSGNPIPGEIVDKLLQANAPYNPNTFWRSIPVTTPRYGDDESGWIGVNDSANAAGLTLTLHYNATEWSNDRGTYFLTIENGTEPTFSL